MKKSDFSVLNYGEVVYLVANKMYPGKARLLLIIHRRESQIGWC
ncbi:MAG: hypothetical protein NTX32_06265 [Candidatus Firestonebacteria bacterium]|nr:hypothetical protein [Candidatus Firestonebacteria bacterium]